MTTFYANSAGAQGTGTGASEANATTLKLAIENNGANVSGLHAALAAGDTIYCKGGTTITFNGASAAFATLAISGTTTAPIRVVGYTTTITDGGIVNITDSNSGATNNCLICTSRDYWHFENIRLNSPRRGFNDYGAGWLFRNCAVFGAVVAGWVDGASTGDGCVYVACHSQSCANGMSLTSRNPRLAFCSAIGNTARGFEATAATYGSMFVSCFAHACGTDGFGVSEEVVMVNCVANRCTGDGIEIVTTANSPTVLINCGTTSNGGYGVNGVANTKITAINCGLHPTNQTNTSGKSHANVTLVEVAEIAGDPLFVGSNPGTPADVNLSLGSASAWKGTGLKFYSEFTATPTFFDVGPSQREESASGGGTRVWSS